MRDNWKVIVSKIIDLNEKCWKFSFLILKSFTIFNSSIIDTVIFFQFYFNSTMSLTFGSWLKGSWKELVSWYLLHWNALPRFPSSVAVSPLLPCLIVLFRPLLFHPIVTFSFLRDRIVARIPFSSKLHYFLYSSLWLRVNRGYSSYGLSVFIRRIRIIAWLHWKLWTSYSCFRRTRLNTLHNADERLLSSNK